ncbi:MAG: hypothetical protein P8Z41_00895, partial [Anaerolineales bacterium]
MFNIELDQVAENIRETCSRLGLPVSGRIQWQPIPFKGQWGFGTNACFQLAAEEARSGKKVNVPERAREIA